MDNNNPQNQDFNQNPTQEPSPYSGGYPPTPDPYAPPVTNPPSAPTNPEQAPPLQSSTSFGPAAPTEPTSSTPPATFAPPIETPPNSPGAPARPHQPFPQTSAYTPQSPAPAEPTFIGNGEPPKKSRKGLFIGLGIGAGLIALLILAIVLIIKETSIGPDGVAGEHTRPNHTGTRTMLIYMVGSDLESDPVQGGAATADLNEIVNAGVSDDVEVVVYAGGAKSWRNGWENGTIYELDGDSFEEVISLGEENTGDPETLQTFVDYAYKNYKSDLYDLIFWNHGSGPVLGFGADELYDDDIFNSYAMLSIDEIADSLSDSDLVSAGKKFELIGFDACLMASAEIAAHLSDYSDWLVASQELEPGWGWDYAFLSGVDRSTDSEALGSRIIDTFIDFYDELASLNLFRSYSLTLSLVDLTRMAELTKKMDQLFGDVRLGLEDGGYSRIVSQMTRAQFFGDTSYDLVDLHGIAKQLEADYTAGASDLANAVEDAVVYQKTNIEGANGLSIYYPYYTKSVLAQLLPIYDKLDFSTEYNEFLSRYSSILSGSKLTNWQLRSTVPKISGEKASVSLGKDVVENYNRASYVIFAEVEGGRWTPVFRSSDVTISDDGTLSASFNRKQFTVTDQSVDGKYSWVSMSEYRRETRFTLYRLPAMLFNAEEFAHKSIYIEYKVDNETLEGEITGYVPMTSIDSPNASKEIIDLSNWDTISLLNFSYKIFDDAGNYTDNWEGGGEIFGSEYRIGEEEIEINLTNLDPNRTYYCLFQIFDTQGNEYSTSVVKL